MAAAVATMLVSSKTDWLDGWRDQRKVLHKRIDEYWQARQAGDLDAQAKYMHPLQKSRALSNMLITDSYAIEALEINGDSATGTIRVRSHISQPQLAARSREAVLKDKWVRYEGQWYQDIGPSNFKEVLKEAQRRLHPDEVASVEARRANKGVAAEEQPQNE
jgi:hypothetical protein